MNEWWDGNYFEQQKTGSNPNRDIQKSFKRERENWNNNESSLKVASDWHGMTQCWRKAPDDVIDNCASVKNAMDITT